MCQYSLHVFLVKNRILKQIVDSNMRIKLKRGRRVTCVVTVHTTHLSLPCGNTIKQKNDTTINQNIQFLIGIKSLKAIFTNDMMDDLYIFFKR